MLLPSQRLQLPAPGPAQQLQPVRGINAWSPAQRYFVEGDHVITAEANRTIQFTGLDAGGCGCVGVLRAQQFIVATGMA
jgi:NADH-ubiquinone oxidoreductase chain 3